jgi:hypothetical protein
MYLIEGKRGISTMSSQTHSSQSRIAGVRITTIFYQIYPSLSEMHLCSHGASDLLMIPNVGAVLDRLPYKDCVNSVLDIATTCRTPASAG